MSFPNRFRIWDSRINGFHKPADEVVAESGGIPIAGNLHPYVLLANGGLMRTDGYHIGPLEIPLDVQFVLEWDTGMVDCKGKPIYEGDVVSFLVMGVAHAVEPDECSSAQVWWCQEDGCWALGKWTQIIPHYLGGYAGTPREYTWWYTFQDRIDLDTLLVLGNVHESQDKLISHPVIA